MKISGFCTKNGSYVPQQYFQEKHKNCPCQAACRFSSAHFGLHVTSVIKAEELAVGRSALFCFGALLLHGISPWAGTRQPCGNPPNGLALLISRFLPTGAAHLTLSGKHCASVPCLKHGRREQCRKTRISDALGLSMLLEGGEEGGTG